VLQVSPDQEKLDWELGLYEYDKDSIEKGKEVPVQIDDHACDALRYCVMGMWPKIRHFLPKAERGG
jgi:phage terminase large subunit